MRGWDLVVALPLAAALSGPSSVASNFARWQACASEASERPMRTAIVPLVGVEAAARRITKFAGEAFDELGSTSQAIRAAKSERLLLNGRVSHMNARVEPGDVVALQPAKEESVARDEHRQISFTEGLLRAGDTHVVFEDDSLAIVHKCAGIHSKPYGAPLSLEHALPGLVSPPREVTDALVRPTCVHRLDARVAGLIVVAKSRSAAAALSLAFRERRVRKSYRSVASLPPVQDACDTGPDAARAHSRVLVQC